MRTLEANEVKKSLLILKSQQQSLLAVETFLRNREWNIHSTTNLKEALTYLISQQPQFVLISIDYPNKKAKNLPKVLMSALPVCVAVFAEKAVAASFKEVTDSATEYKLYPPVTGPAVERMVNKYMKDLTNKKLSPQERERLGLGPASGGDNSTIAIKGQLSASLLAQMMGMDENSSSISTTEGENPSEPKTSSLTHESSQPQGPSFINNEPTPSFMPPADWAATAQSETDPYSGAQAKGNNLGWIPTAPDLRTPTPLAPQYSQEDFEELDLRAKKDRESSQSPEKEGPNFKEKDAAPPQAPLATSSDLRADQIQNKLNQSKFDHTLILKGTEFTLDEVCVKNKLIRQESVEQTSHVACIIIDSSRFSGYLVTAMGKNRKIDDSFLVRVKERLFKFLRENGESPDEIDNSVHLKLRTVPFEAWALDCAEFLRKSIHNGDEIAMAFFPNQQVKAQFQDSAREDMARIAIEEVRCDIVLDFNIYLYLPRNDKYILYTPKGGIFFEHQRNTLTGRGVREVHVQRNELHLVTGLKVQSFLNDTIETWENQNPVNRLSLNKKTGS